MCICSRANICHWGLKTLAKLGRENWKCAKPGKWKKQSTSKMKLKAIYFICNKRRLWKYKAKQGQNKERKKRDGTYNIRTMISARAASSCEKVFIVHYSDSCRIWRSSKVLLCCIYPSNHTSANTQGTQLKPITFLSQSSSIITNRCAWIWFL